MAIKQKEKQQLNNKRVSQYMDSLHSKMDNLYRTTYNADRTNSTDLNFISKKIDTTIDDIINRNKSFDTSNVTRLYTKLQLKNTVNSKEVMDNVTELFSDQGLTNSILTSYIGNKYIKDINNEIDTVCRYMPKLEEALAAKKDAVLSSDNYSKGFLNGTSKSAGTSNKALLSQRIDSLKEKYNLEEKFETYFDDTQKYGEEFIYCVDYDKALNSLLARKSLTRSPSAMDKFGFHEETILENGITTDTNSKSRIFEEFKNSSVKVQFNFSGILESALDERTSLKENATVVSESTGIINEDNQIVSKRANKKYKLQQSIGDELELPKDDYNTSKDGLVDLSDKSLENTGKVNVPGSVIKKLIQENIIPIYIDDICLGYYYLEFTNGANGYDLYSRMMDNYNSMSYATPATKAQTDVAKEQEKIELLRYISGTIANKINKSFVNANQDLAKEIYAILKYNDTFNDTRNVDNIRVSFLSEEDVVHMKFNEDPETHRGISDLLKCLIPAKLYSCLYITNTIGQLTRGQDKRVYYVKQNIETNISQSLLNVVNQIKKSNFGIRQIENMNTILNITGRFNDYIIPVGPSGDAPIQFEVMPGQEFNQNTELMDKLEEMAINSTDVPLEVIVARYSVDFAAQITMTNIKFLRHCYRRQSKAEKFFGRIMTKLYNSEYNENIEIDCILPTPLFMNMNNLNSIIETTKNNIQSIADVEYDDSDDASATKKQIFSKLMLREQLSTYIGYDQVDRIKVQVDMEYSKNKKVSNEDNM